jgi:hypothetical protein
MSSVVWQPLFEANDGARLALSIPASGRFGASSSRPGDDELVSDTAFGLEAVAQRAALGGQPSDLETIPSAPWCVRKSKSAR